MTKMVAAKVNPRLVVLAFCISFLLSQPCTGRTIPTNKPLSSRSLRAMARVYMAYGNYAKAQPAAEKALKVAKENHAADSELCLCLIDLAYLYNSQGDLKHAEQMCILGLKLQEKIYYEKHPYIAYTLRTLTDIYRGQGKYQQAESTLDRAIEIMLDSHLPNDRAMTQFYIDRGRLLTARGQFAEAEGYFERASTAIRKTYGSEHLYNASVLVSRAELLVQQGRYLEAEPVIQHALSIQTRIYGPDHHLLVPAWLTLAKVENAKGHYSRAQELLEKAARTAEDKQGPENPLTARALSMLGVIYASQGQYAKAEQTSRQAVQVFEKTLGPNNDRTAIALNNLAKLYIHQKKYPQAQRLCQRALAILENVFEPGHPSLTEVRQTMTLLQNASGTVATVARAD